MFIAPEPIWITMMKRVLDVIDGVVESAIINGNYANFHALEVALEIYAGLDSKTEDELLQMKEKHRRSKTKYYLWLCLRYIITGITQQYGNGDTVKRKECFCYVKKYVMDLALVLCNRTWAVEQINKALLKKHQ